MIVITLQNATIKRTCCALFEAHGNNDLLFIHSAAHTISEWDDHLFSTEAKTIDFHFCCRLFIVSFFRNKLVKEKYLITFEMWMVTGRHKTSALLNEAFNCSLQLVILL